MIRNLYVAAILLLAITFVGCGQRNQLSNGDASKQTITNKNSSNDKSGVSISYNVEKIANEGCTCHGGYDGVKEKAKGMTAVQIRHVIDNGNGKMPANIVSGKKEDALINDLTNE